MNVELIIYFLLLADSIGCNLVAWFGDKWYIKHFRWFSRFFPPAKGWALFYLVIMVWIGSLLYRLWDANDYLFKF